MFETFADWAAILILIQLGIVTLVAVSNWISKAFQWWVDLRTYRTAGSLKVVAEILERHPTEHTAYPGNIVLFTAIFFSRDNRPMLWKHLSDVTFTPLGDMKLEPLDSKTVTPRDGYARCRFVVTQDGKEASAIAHSGAVFARVELKRGEDHSSKLG